MPHGFSVWGGPVATMIASATAAAVTIIFNRRQAAIAEAQKEIAASQRDIAHEKLKSDLFDRRFAVYLALRGGFVHCIKAERSCEYSEVLRLTIHVDGALYLFSKHNASYLLDLRNALVQYAADCEVLRKLEQGDSSYEEFMRRTREGLVSITTDFVAFPQKIKDEMGVRDLSQTSHV